VQITFSCVDDSKSTIMGNYLDHLWYHQGMSRVHGFYQWIRLLFKIFNGRSVRTYGKDQISFIYERYRHEYLCTNKELIAAEGAIKKFSNLLKIVPVKLITRIGPKKDSGYITVDMFERPLLISGGAGKNIDFEVAFAERGSQVLIFDPTIDILPKLHENITHFKIGLEGEMSNKFKKSIDLNEILKMAKASSLNNPGIYLKLDIEGSEWKLLDKNLKTLNHFDQIFIEFHDLHRLTDNRFRKSYLRVNKYLIENFYFVSVASNNWSQFINFGKSFTPLVYECTLLNKRHKRLLKYRKSSSLKKLTYRNNPKRPFIYHKPFYVD
jgi:hypothetical protein